MALEQRRHFLVKLRVPTAFLLHRRRRPDKATDCNLIYCLWIDARRPEDGGDGQDRNTAVVFNICQPLFRNSRKDFSVSNEGSSGIVSVMNSQYRNRWYHA